MSIPGNQGEVLIVEDDKNIASLLATYLETEGFSTIRAADGEEGLRLAERHRPTLIILDLMLPKVDGFEVCREIRRHSNVPILMLSARGEELDRVLGLSLAADDYVVKPFSPRELVERVKAILRRTHPRLPQAPQPLVHGDLALDPEKHTVTLGGEPIYLTPSEFKLLQVLMGAPGRAFTRDELLGHLHLRGEVVIDRVVDVHIGKLRRKIEPDLSRPHFILTVRGTGYRFAERTGSPG